jgi:hypothetical protein
MPGPRWRVSGFAPGRGILGIVILETREGFGLEAVGRAPHEEHQPEAPPGATTKMFVK